MTFTMNVHTHRLLQFLHLTMYAPGLPVIFIITALEGSCHCYSYVLSHSNILLCIHIQYLVPPSNMAITQKTSNPTLRGSNFELECTASGNHPPTFTWTFNGTSNLTELSQLPSSRYMVNSVRGQKLTVSTATYRDAGRYTCTATNEAGRDSTSMDIEIQGKSIVLYSLCLI